MLVGQSIGPFQIVKELGSGAMGSVYLARYTKDERLVALKVIAYGLSDNESALARFEREAEILKQLRHPNIVRLFATGRYRKTPFFAMEFVEGESLDKVMARKDRFSSEEVIEIGRQLCRALQHAHEKGIIHRDLKPSNLMLTTDHVLKLTDFGIAKDVDVTALTGQNNTIGTAAYMSPEQCKGDRNLSPKSDIYSLGVVFYELLTGRKPFQAETAVDMFLQHVNGTFARPRQFVPDIPLWLDTLVCQMMEKKPEHRPRDAAMVEQVLAEIEEKIQDGRSVGQDVASARAGDLKEGPMRLDAEDKGIAKAIRAGANKKKLKKKKATPIYRRGWFVVTAVLIVLSGMVYGGWLIAKPEPPERLAAKVREAKDITVRIKAAEEYLRIYGKDENETTASVRLQLRDDKVARRDELMFRRHANPKMREQTGEGEDAEAYKLTMDAISAENLGELGDARKKWQAMADKFKDEKEANKAVYLWYAERKLTDLKEVEDRIPKLRKELEDSRTYEYPMKMADEWDERIVEAIRFENLKDYNRAYLVWDKMKASTEKERSLRSMFLLASKYAREMEGNKGTPTPDDRKKKLEELLTRAKEILENPESPSGLRRQARYDCKDVSELYASADSLNELTKRAKVLLEQHAKK